MNGGLLSYSTCCHGHSRVGALKFRFPGPWGRDIRDGRSKRKIGPAAVTGGRLGPKDEEAGEKCPRSGISESIICPHMVPILPGVPPRSFPTFSHVPATGSAPPRLSRM